MSGKILRKPGETSLTVKWIAVGLTLEWEVGLKEADAMYMSALFQFFCLATCLTKSRLLIGLNLILLCLNQTNDHCMSTEPQGDLP